MKLAMRMWQWAAIAVMAGFVQQAGAADTTKRFALERGGSIQLKVPAGWRDETDTKSQPPVISFKPASGQPFIVSIIPAQAAEGKRAPARSQLRDAVEQMAASIRPFAADSDKVKVAEIAGSAAPGFEFAATDAAPAPGEYKFMSRGKLNVGNDVSITFTILTNDGQAAVVKAAHAMLKSATRVAK